MGHFTCHGSKVTVASIAAAALALSLLAQPLSGFAADDKGAAGKAAPATGERPQIWKGRIASLQLDGTKVDWLVSGAWILRAPAGESLESTKNAVFLASITMVKPDGTGLHRHRISDLLISGATAKDGNTSLQGTATVTMGGGPVQDVPIKIDMNSSVVAIWVGPEKVDNHFGAGPIYGTLVQRPGAAPEVSSEAPAASSNAPTSSAGNVTAAAPQSNSTSTSGTNSTSSSGTNSTQATSNPAPAASSPKQGNVIQMAAKDSVNLYSWFVGTQENPTITFAANVDNTISVQNPTDTKHRLVIESGGKQVASTGDIAAGGTGQLTYRPTSAGTLDYHCEYHSTMKGTIKVQ
jgi:plastocyanin